MPDVDDVVDCVEAQPAKISAERMTAKRRVCFFVDKRFGFIKEGSFPYSCSTGVCGWPQRTSRLPLAAAKRIEKFFFVAVVRKAHAIVQLIEAAEACGLDFRKLCVDGVFFENIVEHFGVIERFRDGDAELFFAAAVCTDMEEDEQIQHGARNDREEAQGERDIAAAAGETHGHSSEDDGDVFGVTGAERKRTRPNAPATATPVPTLPLTSIMTVCTANGSKMTASTRLCVKRVRRVYVNVMSAPQSSATSEQSKNEDTVIPDEVKLANTVSMGISFLKSNELFRMHARCACRGCYRRWHI